MEAILYIGISQTLFASVLIWGKKPRFLSNYILASWLLLICIEMTIVLIDETLMSLYPIKILPFTYGPLLLLYAKWMTTEKPRFNPNFLFHFLPFVVFLVISLIYFDEPMMGETDKFKVLDRYLPFRIVYSVAFFTSITTYSVLTFIIIHRHQKHLKTLVSFSSGRITLQWLMGLSITFYVGYILMFIFGGVVILTGFMPFDPYEISFIGLTILTFLFTIFGFHQPAIFEEVMREKGPNEKIELEERKYKRSGLKKKDVDQFISKIEKHMENEKPYLEREFTIYDLSARLQIPRHILSEVINEHMGRNFYKLVNEYRVDEVKMRMEDPAFNRLTILAIAYDSGFNAKSSFNTIFKESTGMTPSDYQRTNRNKSS